MAFGSLSLECEQPAKGTKQPGEKPLREAVATPKETTHTQGNTNTFTESLKKKKKKEQKRDKGLSWKILKKSDDGEKKKVRGIKR